MNETSTIMLETSKKAFLLWSINFYSIVHIFTKYVVKQTFQNILQIANFLNLFFFPQTIILILFCYFNFNFSLNPQPHYYTVSCMFLYNSSKKLCCHIRFKLSIWSFVVLILAAEHSNNCSIKTVIKNLGYIILPATVCDAI